MRLPGNKIDSNITISVSIRVTPGREADFENFLQGITDAAERFPGFEEVRAVRAGRGKLQFQVILRFKEESDLKRWRDSEERVFWSAQAEDLAEGTPRVANITGTAQEQPLVLALAPLQSFVRTNVSGIGLLLLGTLAALVTANSRLSDTYQRLWEAHVCHLRTKIAVRSDGIAWQQVIGAGFLGGIGFTMSLFIAELAFGEGSVADSARVGILFGSVVAGGIGYLMLVRTLPAKQTAG